MSQATHRRFALWIAGLAAILSALVPSRGAEAYVDQNLNRIDDRIEQVHVNGWSAAFVDGDPTQRMVIGVENPAGIVYAVYVGYDHKPNAVDELALAGVGVSMVWPFQFVDYIESRATHAQILAIAALPGVTQVEAVPVDYATNHYGSRVVRARDSRGLAGAENYVLFPSARQELGIDGTGVVVAILDTGVGDEQSDVWPTYPGHEALKGKFLGGGEFWCGQPACVTANNQSVNPQHNADAGLGYHGTHVAATAIGTGGPGGYFAGVAPGARLVDCKVLSDAGASVGGANRGLEWCVANKNTLWSGLAPGSIWRGIDVVNMSLGSITDCAGGSGTQNGLGSALVNTVVDAGLVVVIATGNDDATECIASPAAADKSIAVGAIGHRRSLDRSDDGVTGFSNEGPRDDDGDADHKDEMKPNVVAPGDGIISAEGDPRITDGNDYAQASGTSMATPHVAGCAALVLQADPSLTPLALRTILENTADHFVPSDKGPFRTYPLSTDPNYDPGSGMGSVDVYAAIKEALNSTSGVQVIQIRGIARPADGAIDVRWVTQREYPFLGFRVYRAPDANGSPGAFAQIGPSLVPPSPDGDPVIQNDDNRTTYLLTDSDPSLTLGQKYWYRVEWVDLLSAAHAEPPAQAVYGIPARVATAYYSIAHDAVDNDLLVRVGVDLNYDPGTLGQSDFEVLGTGENGQDSSVVVFPDPLGGTSVGYVDHFWSIGFTNADGIGAYLPPRLATPWFLSVLDGGFINTNGRITSFSLFVNDSPGSASGATYVTNHTPMPAPTVEGGIVPVTVWIPESQPTTGVVATFRAAPEGGAVRVTLDLTQETSGARASVFRSTSDVFATRELLTREPLLFEGTTFSYLDAGVAPGVVYHYWVQVHEPDGSTFMNGPVSATASADVTFAAPPWPNPASNGATFAYRIGADVGAGGSVPVSLRLYDAQGREVSVIHEASQGPGEYRVDWDGSGQNGRRLASGVYRMRFRAGHVSRTHPVVVVD
jgi:subtilisin family serine protease